MRSIFAEAAIRKAIAEGVDITDASGEDDEGSKNVEAYKEAARNAGRSRNQDVRRSWRREANTKKQSKDNLVISAIQERADMVVLLPQQHSSSDLSRKA